MSFVLVVLIGIFCLFFLWPATSLAEEKTEVAVTAKSVKSMSRGDVEKMLQFLSRNEAPKEIICAMCYQVIVMGNPYEYICPVCGEKTLYAYRDEVLQLLFYGRIEFGILSEKNSILNLELDDTHFCKKCHPEDKKPFLVLKVTYKDGSVHECRNCTVDDILFIDAFLKGKTPYTRIREATEGKEELKSMLPRLRELLGIKETE